MKRLWPFVVACAAACAGPSKDGGAETVPMDRSPLPHDPHSFSAPNAARTTRLDLALRVDFATRTLDGVARWSIERAAGVSEIRLDVRGVDVVSVTAPAVGGDAPRTWRLGPEDRLLGSLLSVDLAPDDREIVVRYRTRPDASGLQWLDPAQTGGKAKPFLFSQAQAIHARSFVPCQDAPGVRFPYTATVEVPEGLGVVMSAETAAPPSRAGGRATFSFRQPRPIPAYLLALAVGDLASRATGPRTAVYAEPGVVDAAASEFRDLERMVDAVEELFGPYRWGRYDLLVLPPSFPFGGMENPNMTFATPTLLAGDRSLVSVVAHELAHSWSGNLVTNATWADFWMNEGFTVYLERRIIERLYGRDAATRQAILGRDGLLGTLEELKAKPKLRRLRTNLAGEDPDDGMNDVPYEKGCLLLVALERAVGRAAFDPFLRAWFDEHAFRAATTDDFVAFVNARLPAAAKAVDLARWIDGEDLPADAPDFDASVFAGPAEAADAFAAGRRSAADLGAAAWTTDEWLHFLSKLPMTLGAGRLAELDRAWKLTERGNAEIAAAWLGRAIRAGYDAANARLEAFLTTIGRRKFLKPLYGELLRTPAGRERAEAIYARARAGYHPIARTTLDRMFAGEE